MSKASDQLLLSTCWENLDLSIQNDYDLKLADRVNSNTSLNYFLNCT